MLEQQGLRGRQDDMLQIGSLERTRTAEPQQLEVRGIEKRRQKQNKSGSSRGGIKCSRDRIKAKSHKLESRNYQLFVGKKTQHFYVVRASQ